MHLFYLISFLKGLLVFIFIAVFQIHTLNVDLWGFHCEIVVVILMTILRELRGSCVQMKENVL